MMSGEAEIFIFSLHPLDYHGNGKGKQKALIAYLWQARRHFMLFGIL